MTSSATITQLLLRWRNGDHTALDELLPQVYSELRRLAGYYLRGERPGLTLQSSDLIHETYLRLVEEKEIDWRNRAHFFGIAARLMRQILVARARERGCQKRGGGADRVSLDEAMVIDERLDEDLVALDEALGELSQFDARMAQVVEMRFFGGLTEEEIAAALDVSTKTVRRDWRLARSWLRRKLNLERTDEA